MSNPKKHDSASGGGRRPTEDALESSANVGGGRWSAKRKVSAVLELLRGADLESTSRKTLFRQRSETGYARPTTSGSCAGRSLYAALPCSMWAK
jgi:hypothetical protein